MTGEPADSTYVLDEACSECGDDVPASDVVRTNGYDAVFCSRACRHTWKSNLGRRFV